LDEGSKQIVKIPRALIERLRPFGLRRFLKVAKPIRGEPRSGKGAIENGWTENLYEPEDLSFRNWLMHGGNYGIAAGQGIAFLDIDDPKMQELFESYVQTLTFQSGSGKGRHYVIRRIPMKTEHYLMKTTSISAMFKFAINT